MEAILSISAASQLLPSISHGLVAVDAVAPMKQGVLHRHVAGLATFDGSEAVAPLEPKSKLHICTR